MTQLSRTPPGRLRVGKPRENILGYHVMRITILPILALAVGLGATALPASAKEGGCVKGGAVGAVAGHFVGRGHAVAGAAAGCAVGVHRRNQAEKRDQQQQQQQNAQPQAPSH
jgi:hypothetical protein